MTRMFRPGDDYTPRTDVGDEWFSDLALAKQRALDDWNREQSPVPLELFVGMFEPRVPPTDAERCAHCGGDARPQVRGQSYQGRRFCALCVERGHHCTCRPDPEDGPPCHTPPRGTMG